MSTIEEKIEQLPFLPEIILKLQKIKDRDDLDTNDILQILEEDHFVTSHILKMANSKLFGFSNHIDTFHKAFTLYGINFTISFSIAQIIQESIRLNLDLYEIEVKKFFNLSEYSCKLMLLWLKEDEVSLKEELLLPCLINEIGKSIICSSIAVENEGKFVNALKENPLNISLIEKEFTSYSSSDVSSMILDNWNFDKNIINMIKDIDTPSSKATSILNVIKTIFNVKKPFTKESILLGIKKAEEYSLDTNSLRKALQELHVLIKNDL